MKKILIVEDDDAISTGLKYYLEGEDFDIVLANNGAIALTELDKNNDISLILLDINLPDIGGFDLFKKIITNDTIENQDDFDCLYFLPWFSRRVLQPYPFETR